MKYIIYPKGKFKLSLYSVQKCMLKALSYTGDFKSLWKSKFILVQTQFELFFHNMYFLSIFKKPLVLITINNTVHIIHT